MEKVAPILLLPIQLIPKVVAKKLIWTLMEYHKCMTWEAAQASSVIMLTLITKVCRSFGRNVSKDF